MSGKSINVFLAASLFAASVNAQIFGPGGGQQIMQPPSISHRIDLPGDAPVALVSDEWGGSAVAVRGGAYQLDVRLALSLRNTGQRRIRGITLTVVSQEATPGGKGSISIPSLDVGPGETFPIRGDLRLLRPLGGSTGPMVEVTLDGILFDNLTFWGPNKLNSRRQMMVWELEARRDRQYFKSVYDQSGRDGLQKEMLESMSREADRPQFGAQVVRGRSTNTAPEQEVKFAFLHFPGAPVEAMDGTVTVAGNEARSPKLVVHNRSSRPVQYLEIAWIVKDQQGREFLAATVPAEKRMPSQSSTQILPDAVLRLDSKNPVQSMTGYVSQVEFTDGSLWIPARAEIQDLAARRVIAPSPEEQRLVQIYRKRSLNAVIDELKKF
ncbi:MAG: hypothetical protein ABL995_01700 [Bryobacteraceae bacterium]